MNILKPSALLQTSEYQKLSYHFHFDTLYRKVISGILRYRFFTVTDEGDKISFTRKNSIFTFNTLNSLKSILPKEDFDTFALVTGQSKSFKRSEKKAIMFFLHLDWIMCYKSIKTSSLNKDSIIEYLQIETGNENIASKMFRVMKAPAQRSNIYTLNMDSVLINLLSFGDSRNLENLSSENLDLILKNPLISLLEITKDFENKRLSVFLKEINKICDDIKKKYFVPEEMKFTLKIRKIKRTHKNGMYIAKQNSILLDPRHVECFSHELGHWFHYWFRPEITMRNEAERFAKDFADQYVFKI